MFRFDLLTAMDHLNNASIPLTKKYAMLWNNDSTMARKEGKANYSKAVSNDF
ncbi:hypothetical protein [Cloacibacillus evryensis]|uniref:Uncharacterized protein n=1 Tax=Cloacibacillus evryensis TaxID=508460 RepID=A0AAW5K1F9_9BACT|nr:hypothetical protein [Cloacibacillus evryensis]MCQ4813541.1 hypothetical protein [Cloacibacillus evryensis]